MNEKKINTGAGVAGDEASKIALRLMKEGERGAVLLGAARLDFALERLLKGAMQPHVGGDDNLFDSDRPLATFSAKIALAYRLGLIEKPVEHALQMIRKVRNEFAHSFEDASLKESLHQNRLSKPYSDCRTNSLWDKLDTIFRQHSGTSDELREYICLVVVLVSFMEAITQIQEPLEPSLQVQIKSQQ